MERDEILGEGGVQEGFVHSLRELRKGAPELYGIPTGTKLDEMFYRIEIDEDGKIRRRALGGIPYLSVMNIVGQPDTGKSLFAHQFSVYQAGRGYPVVFCTVETPASFLYTQFKQKSLVMGMDFEKVEENTIVVDASTSWSLRNNLRSFLETLEYAIEKKDAKIVIVDSITGLYENREMLARQIVREVYNTLKKKKVTSILISQKRSGHQADTPEAAGGLAVAHIVDGTIIFSKQLISSSQMARIYRMPLGSVLRTLRIDGCRMTAHDSNEYVFEISEAGLIEIKEKLSDFVRKGREEEE